MVESTLIPENGAAPAAVPAAPLLLPEVVHLAASEASRIPSPGTQRALKAETGKAYDQLCGPDAESADRFQTLIWVKLRRDIPGLRWAQCEDVELQIEAGAEPADPTQLAGSVSLPPSADSGG